ncbi:hypothetical protein AAG906_018195 [Vitis piasezkii]
MISRANPFLRRTKFIEDVEYGGSTRLRRFVFEDECVIIPSVATKSDQITMSGIDQDANPKNLDTLESTRETIMMIPDYYIVYLQEHEFDMRLEDDQISFSQVKQSRVKPIGCKWIYKTKHNSKGNVERYKTRLVGKDFFRIIMTLVDHYDLELHQMDVKIAFLNGDIEETIYMVQLENFESKKSKHLIYRDCSRGILGLSQKTYIDKVLSRFGIKDCALGDTLIAKGDKFNLLQCPKNEIEKKEMENISYASVVGSLMYAQVCTCPNIAYVVGMLGRYLSNPGMIHWKAAKRVMRYLHRTKDFILTYRRSNHLDIIRYFDSDFVGCIDSRRSTFGYVFMLAKGVVLWKSVK